MPRVVGFSFSLPVRSRQPKLTAKTNSCFFTSSFTDIQVKKTYGMGLKVQRCSLTSGTDLNRKTFPMTVNTCDLSIHQGTLTCRKVTSTHNSDLAVMSFGDDKSTRSSAQTPVQDSGNPAEPKLTNSTPSDLVHQLPALSGEQAVTREEGQEIVGTRSVTTTLATS